MQCFDANTSFIIIVAIMIIEQSKDWRPFCSSDALHATQCNLQFKGMVVGGWTNKKYILKKPNRAQRQKQLKSGGRG